MRWQRRRDEKLERQIAEKTRRLPKKLIVVGVIVGLATLVPLVPYWLSSPAKKPTAASASGLRTVIVIEDGKPIVADAARLRLCHPWMPCKNGKDNIDVVVLRKGTMPLKPLKAVVETDENCDADIYGNSHCSNRMKLSNGQVIEVQHDHNMQFYPCLVPGEVVQVGPQFLEPVSKSSDGVVILAKRKTETGK